MYIDGSRLCLFLPKRKPQSNIGDHDRKRPLRFNASAEDPICRMRHHPLSGPCQSPTRVGGAHCQLALRDSAAGRWRKFQLSLQWGPSVGSSPLAAALRTRHSDACATGFHRLSGSCHSWPRIIAGQPGMRASGGVRAFGVAWERLLSARFLPFGERSLSAQLSRPRTRSATTA